MEKRKARTTSGDTTICLPMLADVEYSTFVEDTARYRACLDQLVEKQPELFPAEINQGYCFHGFVESEKLHIRTRRIRLKSNSQAYQLRPDTVRHYMIGYTEEVEKGLYLRRYGVPNEHSRPSTLSNAILSWQSKVC